jgi:signal transduction histidine kinase
MDGVVRGVTLVLAIWMIVLLVRRYVHATQPERRAIGPAMFVGLALVAEFLIVGRTPSLLGSSAYLVFEHVLEACYPLVFLFGLARARLTRAHVGELAIEIGRSPTPTEGLRDLLAERLHDPSLELAFRLADGAGYVDGDGLPVVLPTDEPGRAVTLLNHDGQPIAALVHDPVLLDDPALIEAAVGATRLAVVNRRLEAEVRAQLEVVRASRARIVEAADEQRRRVERDLHDGAQQRLVNVSLALGRIKDRLDGASTTDGETALLVDEAAAETREAIAELRVLARGIHPSILTNAGLAPALRDLANRSMVPVRFGDLPSERLATGIETTAYYAVAEAITNAIKHAHASEVEVEGAVDGAALVMTVRDDGIGGLAAAPRSIGDRIAAAGGSVHVDSPPGHGTTVRLVIPCA